MAEVLYDAASIQSYEMTSTREAVSSPSDTTPTVPLWVVSGIEDVGESHNEIINLGMSFKLGIQLVLPANQLIFTSANRPPGFPWTTPGPPPPTENVFYKLQIKFRGNVYEVRHGSSTEKIVVDLPAGDAVGQIEVRAFTFPATNSESDGQKISWITPWLNVPTLPFVIPSPITGQDGWVTFEKSFGFETAATEVILSATVLNSEENFAPVTISKNGGIYMPDWAWFNRQEIELSAQCAAFAPSLALGYGEYVLEQTNFGQLPAPFIQHIAPSISQDYIQLPGEDHVAMRVTVSSQIANPHYTFVINHTTIHGNAKVLFPDGTVRLLCHKDSGGFDLYKASNTGTTLMFTDLWDSDYHGAQLGYLLDGTLVSYAWKITTEGKYSLYFKRSLNDGASWEIQQTVVENLEQITGLPLLTQNTVTGRIVIGGKYSDNMGLDWN